MTNDEMYRNILWLQAIVMDLSAGAAALGAFYLWNQGLGWLSAPVAVVAGLAGFFAIRQSVYWCIETWHAR